MTLDDFLHHAQTWLPLIGGILALYVTLRIKPIEDRLTTLEKRVSEQIASSLTDMHNYERWRGQITEGMKVNDRDHGEIKLQLQGILDTLLEIRRDAGK